MARALGSSKKRWFVMAVWVALSAGGAGLLVEAATSTDPQDLYPDCPADDDMDFFGDGYCDRATLNVEECGFDGGDCCECTCVGDGVDTRVICLEGNYDCQDTSAACYEEPGPTPTPVENSSASVSRATSSTAAVTGVLAATTLGSVVARVLG